MISSKLLTPRSVDLCHKSLTFVMRSVLVCVLVAVKPKTPWVVNTTYVPGSDTHLIQIGTPYKNDYLSQKLQFELEIWSADSLPLVCHHHTCVINTQVLGLRF